VPNGKAADQELAGLFDVERPAESDEVFELPRA